MPHPHRDVGFIEIASRLMTLLLTTKLLSFALLYHLTEILTPPPPAFSQVTLTPTPTLTRPQPQP